MSCFFKKVFLYFSFFIICLHGPLGQPVQVWKRGPVGVGALVAGGRPRPPPPPPGPSPRPPPDSRHRRPRSTGRLTHPPLYTKIYLWFLNATF
jgi:hypothetical protein